MTGGGRREHRASAPSWIGPDWNEVASRAVAAGCSLRDGGMSPPPFDSLNMGTSTGDEPERVAENRRRLARAAGFDPARLVTATQVHGADVRVVDGSTSSAGECDALVSGEPGVTLGILVADCAPVLLVDARAGIVAACHAGWRGLVAGVAEATLREAGALGADPARMLCWIGPCIGPDDFEIGEDVADELDAPFVSRGPGEARPRFDLPGALTRRLLSAGVSRGSVSWAGVSTPGDCRTFSHRRDGPRTGRMLAFVGLPGGGADRRKPGPV